MNEPITTWLDDACSHCPECGWSDFPSETLDGACPCCGAATIPPGDDVACRICGCVEGDCSWCIELTGKPCAWEEPNLCTACADFGSVDATRARLRARYALKRSRRRRALPGAEELRQHGYQCMRVAVRAAATERKATS